MGWLANTIFSSVGKKLIMALTGLFLCTFLLVHLSGNLALYKHDGGEAFNHYSEFMSTNPLIRVMEVVMVLGFALHMFNGVWLWFTNRMARPVRYKKTAGSETSSVFSRTMIFSAFLILAFLIIHLESFFVKQRMLNTHKSMYDAVISAFANPYYSGFYILALILLGFHLNHGFQSAFQTLGLNHKKYTPLIKALGFLFSILVPLGFATMPIYFGFINPCGGGN